MLAMSDQKYSTKAEEASLSSETPIPDAVPAYGDHVADDLYTEINHSYGTGLPVTFRADDLHLEPNHSYGTGLPTMEDDNVTRFLHPLSDNNRADSPMEEPIYTPPRSISPLPPAAPEGPLSLTLDKALIFPNVIPATALYSLNFTLNTMGTSITLRRSVPSPMRANGTPGKIMDKDLYDIKRPPFDLVTFTLHGKRKSTFPGVGTLHLKSGFATKYWECKFKEKIVLKGKGSEWFDGQGKLVACEVNEVTTQQTKAKGKGKEVVDDAVRKNPGLVFERREDAHDLLVDLLVACWCAKTWHAVTFDATSVSDSQYSWGSIMK